VADSIGLGLAAVAMSVVVFALIRWGRHLVDVGVASRGEMRTRLPSFVRWLVPRYLASPRYVRVEVLLGGVLAVLVAVMFWLAFIGALLDLFQRR